MRADKEIRRNPSSYSSGGPVTLKTSSGDEERLARCRDEFDGDPLKSIIECGDVRIAHGHFGIDDVVYGQHFVRQGGIIELRSRPDEPHRMLGGNVNQDIGVDENHFTS